MTHPTTGHRFQLYDTRTLERLEQIQRSAMEVRELDAQGKLVHVHPSWTATRWIYKPEMELLLAAAAFPRFEITNLAGEPLSGRAEPMAVTAWVA